MPEDVIIFQIKDSRGRTVVCTEDRWYGHIQLRHPSIQQDQVIAAISNPDYGIYRDVHYSDRQVYYRRQARAPRYLKVVVRFDEDDFGSVMTAFPTDSMKRGEQLI